MGDYLKSSFISEDKIQIGDIPAIIFRPKNVEGKLPSIIFYHGWSSNKESQRIRGLIYAMVGYQVLIPDAIYHGERNPIEYDSLENAKYFWKTIFNNLRESDLLVEKLIKEYDGDPNNISIAGNSMGGFTAAGVFTHNPKLKSLLVFNGSCAWEKSTGVLVDLLNIEMTDELREIQKDIRKLDPINHLDLLKDRPIVMLHGQADSVVSIEEQRLFMDKIKPLYKDKSKISLIEYPRLDHYITTNMMEDSIAWLKN